jgi:N,N-dimethylformamidase
LGYQVVTTDQGSFYLVATNGELQWFRDDDRAGGNAPDGSTGWAAASGAVIGSGWGGLASVFSGGGGVIYAITQTGELLFYRDTRRDGRSGWAAHSGAQIGHGWNAFSHVCSGGDGIIYAVKPTGELLWYRDVARDGSNGPDGANGWDSHSGSQIGTHWGNLASVFAGDNGVIYAIKDSGQLFWYQDQRRDGRNGTGGSTGWHPRSGAQIGSGWGVFDAVVPGGGGILYAVTVDGFVLWYRDLANNGTVHWAGNGIARTIRSGWFLTQPHYPSVQAYCVPQSAAPGDRIDFKSSSDTDFALSYVRLAPKDDGSAGEVLTTPVTVAGGQQDAPVRAWRDGCGWRTTFSLTVPTTWHAGLYAAHCAATDGTDMYVTFVVRPAAAQRARIAVLANTNTWNAYNDWGGRSKYSLPPGAVLSFERPNSGTRPLIDGDPSHLTQAELWVLGWLAEAGYPVDVYTDRDFHSGIPDLADYRGLILSTHPEYWTAGMVDRLEAYLAGGGNLIYIGGNGLYERVDLDEADNSLVLLDGDATNQRARSYFRNLTPPRPERAILGVAYRNDNYQTFAPFQVLKAEHPFFAGTGLSNGDHIGALGRNGAASGWEMDTSLPGLAPDGVIVTATGLDDRGVAPANLQLLARGTNPQYGADLTYYDHPGGGFVFAAGSISFGGSLAQDVQLQAIVRNALERCLTPL